jgi:hypothetical protein
MEGFSLPWTQGSDDFVEITMITNPGAEKLGRCSC